MEKGTGMTVTNEAVSRIKGMIATGELTPGSRLRRQLRQVLATA